MMPAVKNGIMRPRTGNRGADNRRKGLSMRSESYSVGYGLGGQGYPLRQKRVTYGKVLIMRNPNPYEDGVDVNYLSGKRRETMSPERVAEINKMSMEEFSQLSAREQRDYAKVPLPPERVRAIMLGLSGKSHLSVVK